MIWKRGKEPTGEWEDVQVFYITSKVTSEGGHDVAFSDGWCVRVLPDGQTSGQKRSRAIRDALTYAQASAADHLDHEHLVTGYRYLMTGVLYEHNLTIELIPPPPELPDLPVIDFRGKGRDLMDAFLTVPHGRYQLVKVDDE